MHIHILPGLREQKQLPLTSPIGQLDLNDKRGLDMAWEGCMCVRVSVYKTPTGLPLSCHVGDLCVSVILPINCFTFL